MSFPAQSFLYFIQVLTVSRGITPYYYKANSLVLLLYHLYLSLVIERFPIKPSLSRKADAKIRTFFLYFQTFRRVFFSKLPRSAASVPESGCKSTDFSHNGKPYGDFFKGFLIYFCQDVDFQRNKNNEF